MKHFGFGAFARAFVLAMLMALSAANPYLAAQSHPSGGSPSKHLPTSHAVEQTPAARHVPLTKFFTPTLYDAAGPFTDSVAVADLRGNGILDLVIANYCGSINQYRTCGGDGQSAVGILLGNGDGTFEAAVTYETGAYLATSVAVGDVNGDGIQDLIVANSCEFKCEPAIGAVSVLLGNGDGTFQPASVYGSGGYYAYFVALADLRNSGKIDIVVTNTEDLQSVWGSVSVLLGNGDGTFQPAVSYSSGGYISASVAVADLNGDDIPDLIVANFCKYNTCSVTNGEVGVLLGNGDGTFQPVVLYDSGGEYFDAVAVGDLRGNGTLDVVTANRFSEQGKYFPSTAGVLLGNGDGTLQPAVSYRTKGESWKSYPAIGSGIDSLVIADLNGDGIPDFAVVEWCPKFDYPTGCIGTGQVNVFLGNGDGTFQKPLAYSSGGYLGAALAIADVNGDGRPDLVVTNACGNDSTCSGANGSVAVLLNETYYASKTALTASPNPSHVNQSVTLTATITPTPPNGELVTFYSGKTNLGTGTTTHGVATLTTSFSKARTYAIKATYSGDPFRKSSSRTLRQVVNQ